ncbi:MAG: ABC transporter ATP-binding protein/permease [Defluviitaleaceae bacterium]|nr:ABC transporter ATP-binding protein/permease [Defluviitaleaceae bacterium]
MNKLKTLARALCVSIKIKGPLDLLMSLLGFPAALIPVFLANQMRLLADHLQDLMGAQTDISYAMAALGAVVGLYVTSMVIDMLSQFTGLRSSIRLQTYINRRIMEHKCQVRYKYIENYDDFQKRIAFAKEHAGGTMGQSMSSIISILQLMLAFVAASLALWEVSWVIVIVLYVTSIPAAILAYLQQDETFHGRAKWMEEGSLAIHYYNMLAGANYLFNGQQEIRHGGLFDYLKARWRAIVDHYLGKKNRLMAKHVKYNAVADILRSGVYLAILLIAAREIYLNPALGIGVFVLVYSLSGNLQRVAASTLVSIMSLAQDIPYMQEFFKLDELEREPKYNGEKLPNGDITFENVNFAYPNAERDALNDITLHIKDGEKIAIVGENGSGKSTLINLLCGMHSPRDGKINVGGCDVINNPASLRGSMSVVFQDFAHYETSIRENITVSDKARQSTDAEILDLLEKINARNLVDQQPDGLATQVGTFGAKANNLSGGQWQKISIARAAYKSDAKIMILDEPTSALDPIAEAELYHNFANLTHGKTTILISHRLGITAIVDRIIVIKDGRIVETGNHNELMAKNAHYAEMYRAQAKWYEAG